MNAVIETIEKQIANFQDKAIMKSLEGTLTNDSELIGSCAER